MGNTFPVLFRSVVAVVGAVDPVGGAQARSTSPQLVRLGLSRRSPPRATVPRRGGPNMTCQTLIALDQADRLATLSPLCGERGKQGRVALVRSRVSLRSPGMTATVTSSTPAPGSPRATA